MRLSASRKQFIFIVGVYTAPAALGSVKKAHLAIRIPATMPNPLTGIGGQPVHGITIMLPLLLNEQDRIGKLDAELLIGIQRQHQIVCCQCRCIIFLLDVTGEGLGKESNRWIGFTNPPGVVSGKRVQYHDFISYGQQAFNTTPDVPLFVEGDDNGR